MSSFLTPIRRKKGSRMGSSSSTGSFHGSGSPDSEGNSSGDDNFSPPKTNGLCAPPPSSWRKIRQRIKIVGRGSILHRNNERGDHLRRLFLKRRIHEAILNTISEQQQEQKEIVEVDEEAEQDVSAVAEVMSRDLPFILSPDVQEEAYELSVRKKEEDGLERWDEGFLEEIRQEVEDEMDREVASAKIREINAIAREYLKYLGDMQIEFPLEVRMKNVTYRVWVDPTKHNKIMTVYNSSFLYPVLKYIKKRLIRCEKRMPTRPRHLKHILSHVSLQFKPGRQYLVLGPPGSGKSTLLRAIAGLIRPEADEALAGCISYNGRTLEESDEFHIKNAFAYIDQLDQHAPRLTVEETFEFAYQCATGGQFVRTDNIPAAFQPVLRQAEKERVATRTILAALGLTEVKDTFVGDNDVRGVSGGQRRRVTVGEMLMSRAPVLCGDEISTGLDASSTYDMVQVILHYARMNKLTRIFALLQPSPETVSLFDDVIVLAEGQIIYAGPIEDIEDYFAEIGFQCPEFTDVADFLQMVATEDGASLYNPDESIRELQPSPPTPSELAEMFRESKFGKRIEDELTRPDSYVWNEVESSMHGAPISNLVESDVVRKKYANRFPKSTMLIFWRFILLWLRDKRVIIMGAVKNILMGVSVGGVFANTDDIFSIGGALFQAGLFIMLGSMQSSSALLQDRIIYYKHTDANFYSAWPFVFGRTLSQMPQTIFDTVTFATLLYYIIGLADRQDFTNFLVYLSILVTFAILMNAQMGLYASFSDAAQFQVFSSCTLLAMLLFGGFIIAPDTIPAYYWFIYWWNPFAWAYRALIVNEFRSERWQDDDPDQILLNAGFVDPNGTPFGQKWVGHSFLYMVPYLLTCCVLSAVGLTFVRRTGNKSPELVPKSDDESEAETENMPFTPVTLSFHDICYEVTASTSKKQLKLLHNVNGVFRPGQMCALMGSSGAGKTTLMDVIALRKRKGTISGEVRLNGWLQDPMSFRRCSGYVEQFDVQSPELTVRETVLFSARLRLDPEKVTDEQKQAFVDRVLNEVELSGLAHALVGTPEGDGLSFAQKKLLSIAVELAGAPSILFLDEPTSGLDSRSARLVVKALRRIADGNRTVCATIHQPSSAVFGLFDELLLLKKGGHVVYHGPLGENCRQLVSYFEKRGAQQIELGDNPANWMLRVISSYQQADLAEVYKKSAEFTALQNELKEIGDSPDESTKIEFDSEFAVSKARRRELVNRRLQSIYWRSPAYNYSRILVSLFIAFLLGSVFIIEYEVHLYTEVEMNARLSVIFIGFVITGIMAILSVLPVMTRIRDMFYRHRDAGMYDSASIGLALGVAEKWFIVLSTGLFCLVFISTSNFAHGNSDGGPYRMISFWGFFTFNFALYSYMGQLFVCLVESTSKALILCSVFIGINNFFAGLIVRPQFMVGGFYALPYYICPGHYVYESLVSAIFDKYDGQIMANVGSDYYEFLVEQGICAEGSTDCVGSVQDYVEVFFGGEYTRDNQMRNALILGSCLLLTRVLTWVALKKIRFAS